MKLCLWLETLIHPTCPSLWSTPWILDLLLDIPQLHMSISYNESPNISHTGTVSVTEPWLMHILIYSLKVQLGNKTIEIINLITVKVKIWDYGQQEKNHIEASEYCKYLSFFFFFNFGASFMVFHYVRLLSCTFRFIYFLKVPPKQV